jgi:hypothetical protein
VEDDNMMDTDRLRGAVEALLVADPECLDGGELTAVVAAASELRGWLDAFEVRCTRRSRELAAAGTAPPPESLLGTAGRRSDKDAAAVTERDRVCEATLGFEDALASGAVSAGHLDALAHVTRRLDDELRAEFFSHEDLLLQAAATLSVDVFERQCRDLSRHLAAARPGSDVDELAAQRARSCVKRWIDKTTGMHHTHLELDPVRDATLHAAVDAQIRRLRQVDGNARTPWAQLQVDAVIAATSGGPGERVPEISVLTDHDTLMAGWHAHSICETDDGVPLPVETVRRMCCDAEILPIVLNGAGEVLDVGRTRRTATPTQRRALRAMHRTCAHPDCTVVFSACNIHHIHWWGRDDGPTNIDNLLPVCNKHHHLIHEGGWTLTMTPNRTATWTRPDGTIHATGTTIDRQPTRRHTRARITSRVRPLT